MKHKKYFTMFTAVIAAATIVGSGFSAWYFGELNGEGVSKANLGVFEVTDTANKSGKFESSVDLTKYQLILDQGKSLNATKGIRVAEISTAALEDRTTLNSYTSTYTIEKADLTLLNNAGYDVNVKYNVKINKTLLNYFDFNATAMNASLEATTDETDYKVYTFTSEAVDTVSLKVENEFSFLEDSVFKWKLTADTSTGKPMTSEEYTSMKNTLTSVSTALVISANEVLTNPNEK